MVQTEAAPAGGDVAVLPASYAQQRLWFLDRLEGGAVYNVPLANRLRGKLDIDALRQALDAVVARHESLRTTFRLIDGIPHQLINPGCGVVLRVVDLTALPDAQSRAERILAEQSREPFDLASDPLLHVALIHVGDEEHILALTLHHIITDGWSMSVLMRELGSVYSAIVERREIELPELAIQYGDYAIWQQAWMDSGALGAQLEYWKGKLAGAPSLLELPTDKPRPARQSFRGATIRRILPPDLRDGVRELCGREGATTFMVLLAAYMALLHRYSGEGDIVVATPVANRSRVELESVIGFMVNTLAMRTRVDDDLSFSELLRRVRDTSLDAFANQDLPFEKLVQELNPERDQSHPPLAQVLFVVQNATEPPATFAGLQREALPSDRGTAKFDLALFATEAPDGLRVAIEYCTDLFEAGTIEWMIEHFSTFLQSAIADPATPVRRLGMVSAPERRLVLDELNETASFAAADRCVHELVAEQAATTPKALAVISDSGELTYAELDARADDLAARLRALGVGPDVIVALAAERSPELMIAVVAVLKAGGAIAPIDPSYPEDRVAHMLADCDARVVLTQERLRDRLPPHSGHVLCLDANPDTWPAGTETPTSGSPGLDGLAYVIYTSGSTGNPKGIGMPHRPLANLIGWQLATFRPPGAARTLQFASLSFDVGVQELFSTWCSGGTLVLVDEATCRDPDALIGLIADRQVERLFLPFVAVQSLCEAAEHVPTPPGHVKGGFFDPHLAAELPSLRELITAGEQLKVTAAVRRFFARHPDCVLTNQYGPSETHVVSSFDCVGDPERWPALPPIGRPISGARIYLLDRHRDPVGMGVPGELYVGGISLARGYLGRPDLVEERFVDDPFSEVPGARMYRTGDLGRYLPDGHIVFLGRADDQVKIRGYRVELGEVEAMLASHPDVTEAGAALKAGPAGDRRLVGYVVPRDGAELEESEMLAHARRLVPGFMVPARIVTLPALPLTPSGKLDRRALSDLAGTASTGSGAEPPQTELERALATIWERILRVEQVALDDDFFALGGHSLLAVQLVHAIEQDLCRICTLPMLFRNGTLRNLANELQAGGVDATESMILRLGHGNGPPVYCLMGIHQYQDLAEELAPDYCLHGVFHPIEQEIFGSGSRWRAMARVSVQDVAARYLETIRREQPTGPYRLIGFCFGGVVAYETARQLRDEGQEVALLAMLDSTLQSVMLGVRPNRFARVKRTLRRATERLPSRLQRRLYGEEWMSKGKQLERLRLRIFHRAMRSYQVSTYDGPMLLIKPQASAKVYSARKVAPDWGWSRYALSVKIAEVPSGHLTHLRRPSVRAVARAVRAELNGGLSRSPYRKPRNHLPRWFEPRQDSSMNRWRRS
jgi:amino acid adenylation domain-containing protein